LESDTLRRFFGALLPEGAPAVMLLMVFGYLERGWLSRPVGGTAAFRDAVVKRYEELGGQVVLHANVDEILVTNGRASGVRLEQGDLLAADAVVSTASTPETVLRLLGGRYDADATRARMKTWQMFTPVVLASFGVESPLADVPGMLLVDRLSPFRVGDVESERLYLRVDNDEPSVAPRGCSVVQAMLPTSYEWWATRGTSYGACKTEAARVALAQIEHAIPGISERVRMTDVATPLTFWRSARSWRGAYEGWSPTSESLFGHVEKKLAGLERLYLAGQWVEPGGGVPTAVMSGRQAVQLLCAEDARPFRPASK
jgi:phytoene dehydrogenase-like protein